MSTVILSDIKESVNVPDEETCFDAQILMPINGVMFTLNELGLKIDTTVEVLDTSTWDEIFPDYSELIGVLKCYIRDKVRLEFDPPSSSYAIKAISDRIREHEWRINTHIECIREES